MATVPAVWFLAIKTNTGTDRFTSNLVQELNKQGVRAEISWLPHHAEYLPYIVSNIHPPEWATVAHINTWLPRKFYPKNIPVVSTLHHCVQDPRFAQYKSILQKIYHHLWITPIERYCVQHTDCLTTVSSYTAQCAAKIFDVKNITIIPNGVDTEKFSPAINTKKNTEADPFKLLFIGTSSTRKGFDLLPKIMQQLGDKFQLYYNAAADKFQPLPSNMIRLQQALTVQDIANLYHDMDALIFPSRLEGFGLVVAEAMASGLPVIVANSSALPELVEHEHTGLICDLDNIDMFIEQIRKLETNNSLRQKLSRGARQTIEQKFNIQQMTQKYINIYKSLI